MTSLPNKARAARGAPDRRFSDAARWASIALARAWGYRAGARFAHVGFEDAAHEAGFRGLRTYTDLVFRSAWNIGTGDVLFESDVFALLRDMYEGVAHADVDIEEDAQQPETRARWADLLETFFAPGSDGEAAAARFEAAASTEAARLLGTGVDGHENLGSTLTLVASGIRLLRNFRKTPPDSTDALDALFVGGALTQ